MFKNIKNNIIFRNSKRKYFAYFCITLSVIFFLVTSIFFISLYISRPGFLEVDYFDVGQGDSALIKTPSHKLILIDGGPDNLVLRRLGENLKFYQRKIDYIILSHFHDDHITGLIEVIKRYDVKNFIYLDSYDSSLLNNLLDLAKSRKVKIMALNNSAKLNLDQKCFASLFNPNVLKIKPDQNNSIITKLECGRDTFLFLGDNSLIVEEALINNGFNLRAMVLKASHHGSKTANSEAFLSAVKPLNFIISVGISNRFNHPSPEILERAAALGFKIFRTDKQGTIKIYSLFK
jgi:beta-lactamase superfamily II metal-dependent hydrolase